MWACCGRGQGCRGGEHAVVEGRDAEEGGMPW